VDNDLVSELEKLYKEVYQGKTAKSFL